MSDGTLVYAVKSFNYADSGEVVEPGELFYLRGLANDRKLVDHNFVREVRGEVQRTRCDACAKDFVDDSFYHIHLNGRIHPESPNYAGPEARTSLEGPLPAERELVAAIGSPKVKRVPLLGRDF